MVSVLESVEKQAGFADLGLEAIEDLLSATLHAGSIALMTGDLEAVIEAQAPLKALLEAREKALAARNEVVSIEADWPRC